MMQYHATLSSGRSRATHLNMAPPKLAATTAVAYKEKDLATAIGGHTFNGAHQRSIEYLRGMDTFLSKVRLLPYAVGTVSIVIRDASAVHIYKPNAGATSTVEENAMHATDGNPFQGEYATSTASHPPTTSPPLHASELQT